MNPTLRTVIFFLFIVTALGAQVCDDPFSIETKVKNATNLQAWPVASSEYIGRIKRGKKITVTCYFAQNDWWYAKTKKYSGYIRGNDLVITQEMAINKGYEIDQLEWKREQLAKAKLENEKEQKELERKKQEAAELLKRQEETRKKRAAARLPEKTVKSYDSPQTPSPKATGSYRKVSRTYYTGPRGGCYYINSNGNKSYVDRSFCGTTVRRSSSRRSGYYRGPRGGCYRYTSGGNKKYVSRAMCN